MLEMALEKKSSSTRSIVIKLPIREVLFLTWRGEGGGAETCGQIITIGDGGRHVVCNY